MAATFTPQTIADAIVRPATRSMRLVTDAALIVGFTLLTAVLAQASIHLVGQAIVYVIGDAIKVLMAGAAAPLAWKFVKRIDTPV